MLDEHEVMFISQYSQMRCNLEIINNLNPRIGSVLSGYGDGWMNNFNPISCRIREKRLIMVCTLCYLVGKLK